MLKIPNRQINLEQNLPSSPGFTHVSALDRYLNITGEEGGFCLQVMSRAGISNITGGEGGFCLQVMSRAGISCMNPPLRMVDDLMVDNRLLLI